MERVRKQDGETASRQRTVQGKLAAESGSSNLATQVNNSPAMVAQRQKLNSLFGEAIQRLKDEEPRQGVFASEPFSQLKEEPAKPNNTGLPDNLKNGIESMSGISMDNVRVHYNSSQPAQLNALAYAQGTDIHVAPGQEQHLPHEAWHVVQQAQGRVRPTMQMREGVPVNDDKGLEHEADVMGTEALSRIGKRSPLISPGGADSKHETAMQRKPAVVTGLTHLVEKVGNSLMKGREREEVTGRDELDVAPDVRIRSRRGPNQELVGDYDRRGEHIYRWFLVNKLNSVNSRNRFIREDTFHFSNVQDKPRYSMNLDNASDKRTRQSHVAVRFEVWCNKDRKIDSTGHLVMADKSREYMGLSPYFAYEMGKRESPQETPGGKRMPMGSDDTEPLLAAADDMYTSISVKDARNPSKRVPGTFKTLEQLNESAQEIDQRLRTQKRYVSQQTGTGYMQPGEGRQEEPRFNKRAWMEMLVTRDEYNFLMSMWVARKSQGFYCFIREARTVAGYEYATRCLSSLEDIAIKREQSELTAGHAEVILKHFAELNGITRKHEGVSEL